MGKTGPLLPLLHILRVTFVYVYFTHPLVIVNKSHLFNNNWTWGPEGQKKIEIENYLHGLRMH